MCQAVRTWWYPRSVSRSRAAPSTAAIEWWSGTVASGPIKAAAALSVHPRTAVPRPRPRWPGCTRANAPISLAGSIASRSAVAATPPSAEKTSRVMVGRSTQSLRQDSSTHPRLDSADPNNAWSTSRKNRSTVSTSSSVAGRDR